ncbi:MAG: hypothetical protein P8I38_13635 [Arenicella sp.]|nr:hypothetical protein [Arenicella sp.]
MFNHSLRAIVALFILFSFSSVYAQTKVVVIPLFGDDAPAPIEYAIGDTGPAGGIVFHVTNGGLNGLEAAPVDQASAPWNCNGTDVAGVDNIASAGTPDSNSGAVNTPLIAVACGGAAAVAAVYIWPNGQADGFLPNKEELDLLYDQKVAGVVGSFAGSYYWSSSEIVSVVAWGQDFDNGDQGGLSKFGARGVRAVRAF